MELEINKDRIQSINQMLLEMAGGNFTHRIPRTAQDDALESLIVLINMLAEEMKASNFYTPNLNIQKTNKNLVPITFILDSQFAIKSFNSIVTVLLGIAPEAIYDHPFETILSKESLSLWNFAKNELYENPDYHDTLQLVYVTKELLLVPVLCTISRLMNSSEIIISSVVTLAEEPFIIKVSAPIPSCNKLDGFTRLTDVHLLQKVYDYILEHLDAPLPSLKELSRIFATNENKLKYGFKHLFETSIHQFYNRERLEKAHALIKHTTIPLKKVASMSGFATYPNFSKAFKKSFGCAPKKIKRM